MSSRRLNKDNTKYKIISIQGLNKFLSKQTDFEFNLVSTSPDTINICTCKDGKLLVKVLDCWSIYYNGIGDTIVEEALKFVKHKE